ncbi:MAG TPA: NAD(P)-binding domain-containing protein, partial [Puia sp.]|nr:NAD(P)-binding domain-containing protein [Puia sp.]
MKQKSKVAVIGLGNIGSIVAANLVKGNRPVIIADRKPEKAKTLAQQLGSLAQPSEIRDAIKNADIIVLATWYDAIKELFHTYANELQGKIIIDPSNPIAPDDKGGFKKIIGENQSAGEILSSLLPKNAKLVKALGTLAAASLAGAAFQDPAKVLFYASDAMDVRSVIEELI